MFLVPSYPSSDFCIGNIIMFSFYWSVFTTNNGFYKMDFKEREDKVQGTPSGLIKRSDLSIAEV